MNNKTKLLIGQITYDACEIELQEVCCSLAREYDSHHLRPYNRNYIEEWKHIIDNEIGYVGLLIKTREKIKSIQRISREYPRLALLLLKGLCNNFEIPEEIQDIILNY